MSAAVLRQLGLALLAATAACSPGSQQGYEPRQPREFSHARHAGPDNQIPCLYCHSGALVSRHAGVPAASVCMTCHAQIRREAPAIRQLADDLANQRPIAWTKVHRLPDHTFFSHASHLDVACQSCHGEVETMARVAQTGPHSMGSCLECHRQPSPAATGEPRATTDCVACHR